MSLSIELSTRVPTPVDLFAPQNSSQFVTQPPERGNASNRRWARKEYVQFASLCWAYLLTGYSDASAGPLIPRVQQVYNVNFAVVSLIFVFNMLGFVFAALTNMWLAQHVAFGKLIVLSTMFQAVAFAIMAPGPPFPVFIFAYLINGFGISLLTAHTNGYLASQTRSPAIKMGLLHASYGVGALVAPLVATQFASLPKWSYYFLTSLGLALVNAVVLSSVFRGRSQTECLLEMEDPIAAATTSDDAASRGLFKQVMRRRVVHNVALFILIYVGLEVTIGGWTVTYVINERGGDASSGYISSGFFGGLFVGRIALLWVNHMVGARRVIFIYAVLVLVLEAITWRVPSLIGDGIAVSFAGFFLGPMYPLAMLHAASILPLWLVTGAAGYIAGLGQAGSALFPFITGSIASKAGIEILQPLLLGLTGFMTLAWVFVPSAPVVLEAHREE